MMMKLFFPFAHVPNPAPNTTDGFSPEPLSPPIPSRYTGVSDCGHLYAPGGKLKFPPLSVVTDARIVPVDP